MPDLVDTTEIARRLGVAVSTVHKWRHRNVGFPAPEAELKIGPVWEWEQVQAWAVETGRGST